MGRLPVRVEARDSGGVDREDTMLGIFKLYPPPSIISGMETPRVDGGGGRRAQDDDQHSSTRFNNRSSTIDLQDNRPANKSTHKPIGNNKPIAYTQYGTSARRG